MEDIEKDMKPKFIEDLGMRFMTEKGSRKYRYGLYECQYCGKEFEAQSNNIKHGQTKSCGCQRKGINKTHGMSQNKFYKTWHSMLQRCTNPMRQDYKWYGARGITVCGEWQDVKNFTEWCNSTYPKLEGYTLDRIDSDKGYSPDNCTWSDKTTQAINQRISTANTSGFVGVGYHSRDGVWTAYISINNARKRIGSFKDKIEAILARDNYIIENKLPHKLSILNTGI